MESLMNLPAYEQRELVLPAIGAWPESWHIFDDQQVRALRAAEAAGRPLLVQGDPGTGKSQLAQAAAVATERALLSVVVDARSEAHELMWRFDAVARLADAHLAALPGGKAPRSLRPVRYVGARPPVVGIRLARSRPATESQSLRWRQTSGSAGLASRQGLRIADR
ncbi:MAG: AAA family ATPase [Zoogloea sp.]|nr:AAA family ATPase [Zoogloea sp.]